jgi:hypothetical protein
VAERGDVVHDEAKDDDGETSEQKEYSATYMYKIFYNKTSLYV